MPAETARRHELPAWLRERAPLEAPRGAGSRRLRRSTKRSAAHLRTRPVLPPIAARRWPRGRIVHRLMQSLPEIPRSRPQGRRRALSEKSRRRFLRRRASRYRAAGAHHPQRFDLCRSVCAGKPRRSADRRPRRADGATPIGVSGQVDRLAVTREFVLIADYKTDRAAPRQPDEVPQAYIGQLALYRAVLKQHLPGKNDSRRTGIYRRSERHRRSRRGDGGGTGRNPRQRRRSSCSVKLP